MHLHLAHATRINKHQSNDGVTKKITIKVHRLAQLSISHCSNCSQQLVGFFFVTLLNYRCCYMLY